MLGRSNETFKQKERKTSVKWRNKKQDRKKIHWKSKRVSQQHKALALCDFGMQLEEEFDQSPQLVIEQDVFFKMMQNPKNGHNHGNLRSDTPCSIICAMKLSGEVIELKNMIFIDYILNYVEL